MLLPWMVISAILDAEESISSLPVAIACADIFAIGFTPLEPSLRAARSCSACARQQTYSDI